MRTKTKNKGNKITHKFLFMCVLDCWRTITSVTNKKACIRFAHAYFPINIVCGRCTWETYPQMPPFFFSLSLSSYSLINIQPEFAKFKWIYGILIIIIFHNHCCFHPLPFILMIIINTSMVCFFGILFFSMELIFYYL